MKCSNCDTENHEGAIYKIVYLISVNLHFI